MAVLPDIQKIAVLRANALGDLIFALPALTALRQTYPEAEIVLLARQWHRDFLSQRPAPVDRVIVIPQGGIGSESAVGQDPEELANFFRAMVAERFDLAIQLHGGGRNSNPFCQNLGARTTIGLRTPDALPLDRWVPYVYYQSEILRYLEVVALVGAKTTEVQPKITVTEVDRAEARQVLAEVPAPVSAQPLIALHPGATDSRRRWSTTKFAALGDFLVEQGSRVVVTGTAPERPLVEAVVRQMRSPALDLAGKLSLGGLTGLLSGCQLVISNDSGPLHLAAAVGTATIGIYWCGNLITAGLPLRSQHRPLISWRLDCPVCGLDCTKHHCEHRDSFVDDVSVEEVETMALELLP